MPFHLINIIDEKQAVSSKIGNPAGAGLQTKRQQHRSQPRRRVSPCCLQGSGSRLKFVPGGTSVRGEFLDAGEDFFGVHLPGFVEIGAEGDWRDIGSGDAQDGAVEILEGVFADDGR